MNNNCFNLIKLDDNRQRKQETTTNETFIPSLEFVLGFRR